MGHTPNALTSFLAQLKKSATLLTGDAKGQRYYSNKKSLSFIAPRN